MFEGGVEVTEVGGCRFAFQQSTAVSKLAEIEMSWKLSLGVTPLYTSLPWHN